ncbi:MAG: SMC-Scp complex subunit ScpB [Planctomycetota bacterium]|nr:SMC-Scp complex subunit ScpB [Planctomycetota bacterium]
MARTRSKKAVEVTPPEGAEESVQEEGAPGGAVDGAGGEGSPASEDRGAKSDSEDTPKAGGARKKKASGKGGRKKATKKKAATKSDFEDADAGEMARDEVDSPQGEKPSADTPDPGRIAAAVEAILLTLDKPITAGRLAEGLGLSVGESPTASVKKAIEALNESYEASGRAFRIENVAGGFRLMTLPAHADVVASFHAARSSQKLSRAAVETLAIIAYRQPITRAELEAIRGVACGEVLRSLLDRRLIAIVGRAEELGRPMLYGTSKRFLEVFGLSSVKDLPKIADFKDLPPALSPEPEADSSDEADSESQSEAAPTPEGEAQEEAEVSSDVRE